MTRTLIPDDDELDRIALDALPAVLERIRVAPRRRRRLLALGGAAVILAGAAVAGAGIVVDPGDGIDHMGARSTFALDCYGADGVATVENVYGAQGPGSDAAHPVATCLSEERTNVLGDAATAAARRSAQAGAACGQVLIDGVDGPDHWTRWSSPDRGRSLSSVTGASAAPGDGWSASCLADTTTIARPTMPRTDLVACERAADWVEVRVLAGRTPAAVCGAHGETVWTSPR